MTKKTKKVSKKSKSFFLKDLEDTYRLWSEEELAGLDFLKLLELILENKLTLDEYLIKDAVIGEHLVDDIPVVAELSKSLDKLYEIYPTVKQYCDTQQKLLNLSFTKA